MLHVIVAEDLVDRAFVAEHTVGFDALAAHLTTHTPAWAAEVTGVPAERIVALARRYATTRPATIVLGGSSMHKGAGTLDRRARHRLPARAHRQRRHRRRRLRPAPRQRHARPGPDRHRPGDRAPPAGRDIPNQMSRITEAMLDGRLRVMLLLGTDMLSSFADAGRVAEGLARQDLVVCYDLFLNDTARRFADVVLPATAWLEELGCKSTNTHLYLMPKVAGAAGRDAADRRGCCARWRSGSASTTSIPWASDEGPLDAILDHPATGHATVAALRAEGGMRALDVSHVAHPGSEVPDAVGEDRALLRARAQHSGCRRCPCTRSRPRRAVSAHAAPGTHAHALPRLLRPRSRAADAGRADPEPRAVDLARRRRRARGDDGARSASTTSAARCRAGARDRADSARHRVDARRLARPQRPHRRRRRASPTPPWMPSASPAARRRSTRAWRSSGSERGDQAVAVHAPGLAAWRRPPCSATPTTATCG